MDALLLRIMKHRNYYESLFPEIDRDTLHSNTQLVLEGFGKWFAKTKDEVIDIEDFKVYFFNFLKPYDTSEKKRYFNRLLDHCKPNADKAQTEFITEKLIAHTFATQIGNLVTDYDDDKEIDIIQEVGLRHERALTKLAQEEEDDDNYDIEELLDADEYQVGIKFGIHCLADGIRPLQSGDFIIVAGRPDTGKTSFLASQLYSFLSTVPSSSSDRPILWFNNEGEGNRIIKRIYQSILNATVSDLLQARADGTLKQQFADRVGDPSRIRVKDCHGWTAYQVEKEIKKHNPFLVIFDMIDNISFPGVRHDARTDQILEQMYQWARILGVKYNFPVIATSQISADAEQQVHTQCWPAQHMLKDSKTGKQGAADVIVMIGRNLNPDIPRDRRYISTPKNKLAKEHSYLMSEVEFDAKRARYT